MIRQLSIYVIIFLGNSFLFGQEQFTSDAYLLEYEVENDTFYLTQAHFLNAYNNGGYNAEISFINANQLLLISNKNPQQAKTSEVVFLDVFDQSKSILTQNSKQESCPMIIDDEQYSAVQTSNNTGSHLNVFDLLNTDSKGQLFSKLQNVYSSCWLDDDTVILQLKSDLDYMAVAYRSDESFKILEANVGSRFIKSSAASFYYVHKLNEDISLLKHYDLDYLKKRTIVEMPAGVDIFTALNDGSFLCAKGSKIYRHNPTQGTSWHILFDLAYLGIDNIIELQSFNNRISIVNKK